MTEQWIKWEPINGLIAKYYIDDVSDTIEKGFIILLSDENNDRKIKVIFKNSVASYKITDEIFRHGLILQLDQQYGANFYGD